MTSKIPESDNPLPADQYDPDTLMSFGEWVEYDHCVLKGQQMRCRDATGVPQFSVDQVVYIGDQKKPENEFKTPIKDRYNFVKDFEQKTEEIYQKHHNDSFAADSNPFLPETRYF